MEGHFGLVGLLGFRWQHRAERLENSFLAAAGQAGKLAG